MGASTSAALAVLAMFTVAVLAQPSPPTDGVSIGIGTLDVRFPLNVYQCEPVLIYYNSTAAGFGWISIWTSVSGTSIDLVHLDFPVGIGYLDWICNIPAGYIFIAGISYHHNFVVQPGPSSCLGNVTTTYSHATYLTTAFQSYTSNAPNTTSFSHGTGYLASITVPFPTGSFSTMTLNPAFVASPTSVVTSTPTILPGPSLRSATPSPSALPAVVSSRKSKTPAVVGGIIGGAVCAIAIVVVLCLLRRGRKTPAIMPFDPPETSEPEIRANASIWNRRKGPAPNDTPYAPVGTSEANASVRSQRRPLPPDLAETIDITSVTSSQEPTSGSSPSALITREPMPPPYFPAQRGQTPANSPASGRPTVSEPDAVTALNMITQLDPAQQRAVLSVLTTLIPQEEPSASQ